MRTAASLALILALASGCFVRGGAHVRVSSPGLRAVVTAAQVATAVAATAVAIHDIAVIVSTPPPAPVDVYFEHRPGYVWIHGRQTWTGSAYAWTPGTWVAQRPGQVYVEGYWTQTQGGYGYVEGSWTATRPGYVYAEGYWNQGPAGYVWTPGQWHAERPGQVWVAGAWSSRGGQQRRTPRSTGAHQRTFTSTVARALQRPGA